MANPTGPFTLTKFFGASVMNYSSTIGWNEQSSTVTINLVEDLQNGDHWSPRAVGTPCILTFQGFTFQGLVQRYIQKGDFQGNPTYEVSLVSPTEILAGAQVILGSFYQPTGLMPNLLNVFGYWENQLGFGGSLSNESGMLWQSPYSILDVSTVGGLTVTPDGFVGIKPAIEFLTAGGGDGSYGGRLQFRGHTYSVDFGGLPLPPNYYRTGGTARSIIDMVSEICQDGGSDYIVYLEGSTIKFRSVSRLTQPAIGQIANYVNAQKDITAKSVGIELRNDVTNAVLLGGDFLQLVQVTNPNSDQTIWPYWGLDANNQPIVGVGMPEQWHEFYLNAAEIADITGSQTYHCTIPELRLAAAGSFDGWATWILRFYPDKAQAINLIGAIDDQSDLAEIFPDGLFQKEWMKADPVTVFFMGGMNESDYWVRRAQRVFEFVQTYATQYFGRKFLVKIPFSIFWSIEPETTHVIKSDEPTDLGFQVEGSQPLGLSFLNEDLFTSEDGRIECFCLYTPDYGHIDMQKMTPENAVAQQNGLFVRATVDLSVGIVYLPGSLFPYCVVEVTEAVTQLAPDPVGGIADLSQVLGYTDPNQLLAFSLRHGDLPLRIAPSPYRPIGVAVPMKSNRMSYGPWGTFSPWGQIGLAGKVNFERDESLTPWEYGDINTMNLAASAKMANAATNMQETETGHVERAGFPELSLGDTLVAGGPNVTGISVSAGAGGVTTTYEMRTFTRLFGAFAKENADRLRRLGIAAQQTRRAIRSLYHRKDRAQQNAWRAQMGFMQNTSRAVQQRTPHDILYGRMAWTETYGYRTQCSASTYPDAIANCRGDQQPLWQAVGAMSMEALLRPFSTNYANPGPSPGTGDMPHYEDITDTGLKTVIDKIPNRKTLDPFGDYNDIDIMAWGDAYPGDMHTIKAASRDGTKINGKDIVKPDYKNARLMGLRMPLVGVGWGFDYTGKPFPNSAAKDVNGNPLPIDQWASTFSDKYRQHPEDWKAGPIDLHYDMWRKCWTIPTILKGTLDSDLTTSGGTPVKMSIKANGTTLTDKVSVDCDLGGPTLTQGTNVVACYYPLENKFYIIAAACTS